MAKVIKGPSGNLLIATPVSVINDTNSTTKNENRDLKDKKDNASLNDTKKIPNSNIRKIIIIVSIIICLFYIVYVVYGLFFKSSKFAYNNYKNNYA
jgi:beta-lactamase regulating signal transducer with metallopeptidase domain